MAKKILTIAGSDSSGGAGIQADIKTMSALGGYAMSVICSVTAQNTMGVNGVYDMSPEAVAMQLDAVFEDIGVDAVKIGMVSNAQIAEVVAKKLAVYKPPVIICDPVMVSTSGHALIKDDAKAVVLEKIFPLSTLVTPNIPEAEAITGIKIDSDMAIRKALNKIHAMGCKNVLIKGGHSSGDAVDTLLCGDEICTFTSKRIDTKNTHGTGCTLSSAIATFMAQGNDVRNAVEKAKVYLTHALENAYDVGHGHGPVNHFWKYEKK